MHAQASLSAHPLVIDGVEISFSVRPTAVKIRQPIHPRLKVCLNVYQSETRPSEWPTERSLLRDRPDRRCWLRPELNLHSADSFAPEGFLQSFPQASEHWARTTRALKDESAGYWVDETLVAAFDRMQIDPTTVSSDTATSGGVAAGDTRILESSKRPSSTRPDSLDLAPDQPQKRSRRDGDGDGAHERNDSAVCDTRMSLDNTQDKYSHGTAVIYAGDADKPQANDRAASSFVHIFGVRPEIQFFCLCLTFVGPGALLQGPALSTGLSAARQTGGVASRNPHPRIRRTDHLHPVPAFARQAVHHRAIPFPFCCPSRRR